MQHGDRPRAEPVTLAEFAKARLDEVERAALAISEPAREWHCEPIGGGLEILDGRGWTILYGDVVMPEMARHIALHDPARVLREVEAGRKLLAEYEVWEKPQQSSSPEFDAGMRRGLQMALEIRAAVWSDHADYQEQWKP
jgi:hypothetical protein